MPKIITISREFGSGGREIGKRLSEELDFAYYDQEIIKEICKQTGMNENFVNEVSERAITLVSNQFGHTFYNQQQIDILVSQQRSFKNSPKRRLRHRRPWMRRNLGRPAPILDLCLREHGSQSQTLPPQRTGRRKTHR